MNQYLLYLVIVTITVASPGPGVILTLSNALRYGTKPALAGALGISLGILLIAIISATSLGVLLSTSALAFSIFKYMGAAYLIYLGVKLWRSPAIKLEENTENKSFAFPHKQQSHKQQLKLRFKEGLLVSVLNPKAIFFFMALFPQFIHHEQHYSLNYSLQYLLQFTYLTLTFCMMILVIHAIYIVAANSIKAWLLSPKGAKTVNRTGGSIFILFGFGLATSNR